MSLFRPSAGASAYGYGNTHAHALADLNAADQRNVNSDKDVNMDNKPNPDEHEHAYIDRHGNRVTYRHVHIFPAVRHANPDPSANLDADDYRDLDANTDLHPGAALPARDVMEREGGQV